MSKQSKVSLAQLDMFANWASENFKPTGDIDRMTQYCVDGIKVMRQRNKIYRGAYRLAGLLGVAMQIVGCSEKLRTLVTIDPKAEEFIDDNTNDWATLLRNVLIDIHNFSVMGLLMLDEDNFNGSKGIVAHYYPEKKE